MDDTNPAIMVPFNNNIRCIEMFIRDLRKKFKTEFNNNIRCIEILEMIAIALGVNSLITT